MRKTRFQALPKIDRDWIQRYAALHSDWTGTIEALIDKHRQLHKDNISGLQTRSPGDTFASSMFFLASAIVQRAIIKRLLDDDVAELRRGMLFASRLQYLSQISQSPTYSGCDCLHVFNMLESYAVRDVSVIAAYLKRFPGPAKKGHPFTILLCNAVTAVLSGSGDLSQMLEKLRHRKEGKYDKAMLLCLAGIIEKDVASVRAALEEMLAGHRRKSTNEGMVRFFPIWTHGLFNLATDALQSGSATFPAPSNSELWDQSFHEFITDGPKESSLQILDRFSPQLLQCAIDLPIEIVPSVVEQ